MSVSQSDPWSELLHQAWDAREYSAFITSYNQARFGSADDNKNVQELQQILTTLEKRRRP